MVETLGEEYLEQLARIKELKKAYDSIPTGVFGSGILADVISRAEDIWEEQDIALMIPMLEEMKGCE